jgi:Family of unknown function (DUF6599)
MTAGNIVMLKSAAWLLLLSVLPTGTPRHTDAPPPGGLYPEIPGWTLRIEPTVYTRSNLWDLIDGAADLFLLYGFDNLRLAEYSQKESMDVRVEIYDHGTSLNAFGMYSQERKPDYHFLSVGTQGYSEEGVLNFFLGRYYVKCSTHMPGSTAQEALLSIARAVAAQMKEEPSWPPLLQLLPAPDRVPNSELYVSQDFMGYSFFRSAYTALYGKDSVAQLFVMPFESERGAQDALRRFLGMVHQKQAVGADGAMRVDDPNNGRVALLVSGKYLAGVLGGNASDTEARYIALLKTSLSAAP